MRLHLPPMVSMNTLALGKARNRIRNAGMRITKPRIAIIESLLRHAGPISIERIHQVAFQAINRQPIALIPAWGVALCADLPVVVICQRMTPLCAATTSSPVGSPTTAPSAP